MLLRNIDDITEETCLYESINIPLDHLWHCSAHSSAMKCESGCSVLSLWSWSFRSFLCLTSCPPRWRWSAWRRFPEPPSASGRSSTSYGSSSPEEQNHLWSMFFTLLGSHDQNMRYPVFSSTSFCWRSRCWRCRSSFDGRNYTERKRDRLKIKDCQKSENFMGQIKLRTKIYKIIFSEFSVPRAELMSKLVKTKILNPFIIPCLCTHP